MGQRGASGCHSGAGGRARLRRRAGGHDARRARDFVVLDMAVVALALVTALVVVFASRRAWRGATLTMAEKRGRGQNDNARAAAQELLRAGYQGMVSGHTHHPELSALSAGF